MSYAHGLMYTALFNQAMHMVADVGAKTYLDYDNFENYVTDTKMRWGMISDILGFCREMADDIYDLDCDAESVTDSDSDSDSDDV